MRHFWKVRLALGTFFLLFGFLLFGAYALSSAAEGSYHLVKTIPLGAAPGGASILTTSTSMGQPPGLRFAWH